jgi:hypothetical protein
VNTVSFFTFKDALQKLETWREIRMNGDTSVARGIAFHGPPENNLPIGADIRVLLALA